MSNEKEERFLVVFDETGDVAVRYSEFRFLEKLAYMEPFLNNQSCTVVSASSRREAIIKGYEKETREQNAFKKFEAAELAKAAGHKK
jgi:hypothetical protein